jgi:hypothetical protein
MLSQCTRQAISSSQFAMTEKQEWSIAVSWDYVVEVYKGTLFYQYLEVCQRLFTTISITSLCKNET